MGSGDAQALQLLDGRFVSLVLRNAKDTGRDGLDGHASEVADGEDVGKDTGNILRHRTVAKKAPGTTK